MRSDKILGMQFAPVTPAERTLIVSDFTDKRLNPFRAQRFPSCIEQQLDITLDSVEKDLDKQLLVARHDADPVVFILCSAWETPPVLHLAGVWPACRGHGVFGALAEALITQCHPDEVATVYIRHEMYIAIRQLKKLGYRDIHSGKSTTFFKSDAAA